MKKLIKRILFGRRNKMPQFTASLNVVVIEEQTEKCNEALGISEERFDELLKKITDFSDGKNMIQCLVYAGEICKHPNELSIVCYHIGVIFEKNMQMQKAMEHISKMFGK